MRKYGMWSRTAQSRPTGFAVLYSSSAGHPLPQRAPAAPARERARYPRSKTAARRRRIVLVLFAALLIPTLIAVATGWTVAWWVVVALLPVVSVYLFVLFRTRRLLAEREINAAFCGRVPRREATLAELFTNRPAYAPDELRAVSGGRY
ncbi:MAG TPA: hypothetical protein VME46_17615 [Acidimicrobiales bacterium]|nr:hypothetical protein [Acidimicrobiales bacterium]